MQFPVFFCILGFLVAMNSAREVNEKCLNFIKNYEKWEKCAYKDAVGKLTIGYGHLITSRDGFNAKSCITLDQGLQLFKSDISVASKCIESAVQYPLKENEFGALVSWAYNIGCGAAKTSTLVKEVNEGKTNGVCEQLKRWNKGGGKVLQGLVRRRDDECKLFTSG